MKIGSHDVAIGHPDKLLFPADGITKQDLVDYYRRAAPWIVPHVRGRPVAMERYPDGITRSGFFQKTVPCHFACALTGVRVSGGSISGSLSLTTCRAPSSSTTATFERPALVSSTVISLGLRIR